MGRVGRQSASRQVRPHLAGTEHAAQYVRELRELPQNIRLANAALSDVRQAEASVRTAAVAQLWAHDFATEPAMRLALRYSGPKTALHADYVVSLGKYWSLARIKMTNPFA